MTHTALKFVALLSASVVAAALALPVSAATIVYSATLSGANEDPPVTTNGTGWARVTIDDQAFTMRVEAAFADLTGTVTAAHIHCCTAFPLTGNIGVATTTPTFPGFPAGETAGAYDQTFDITMASSYNPAFITANGGTPLTAFAALFAGLNAGKAYFNVHTTFNPGGEIRGFLQPVPLPAAAWLLLSGLAGLGLLRRRR